MWRMLFSRPLTSRIMEVQMCDIRPVRDLAAFDQVVRVQLAVWGPNEICPRNHLKAIDTSGGVTMGAFSGERLVGFALAWPGRDREGVYLYSHMLAVLPEARGKGLGAAIKWAQRAWALEAGMSRMAWTFDPFQFVNARLNLVCLGARAVAFMPDCYGAMEDGLNFGLPSDRFLCRWDLEAPDVIRRARGEAPAASPREDRRVLPFPGDVARLKAEDMERAVVWRRSFAEEAQTLFDDGYVVEGVLDDGPAYLFVRGGPT